MGSRDAAHPCPAPCPSAWAGGLGPPPYASLPPAKRTRGNRSVLGALLLPDPSGLGLGPLTGQLSTELWVTLWPCADHHQPRPPPPGPGNGWRFPLLSSATAWTTQLSPPHGPRGPARLLPSAPRRSTSSSPILPLWQCAGPSNAPPALASSSVSTGAPEAPQ